MASSMQMNPQNRNLLPEVPSGARLIFLDEDDNKLWMKFPDDSFEIVGDVLPTPYEEGKFLKVVGGILVWSDGGGGGGGGVTEVTFAELKEAMEDGELEPGGSYLITDYATTYGIFSYNDGSMDVELRTAKVEPLIVFATGANTLDKQALSTIHPSDIIYYDATDDCSPDGTFDPDTRRYVSGSGTLRTGRIYYRKDTVNNLECWYDWRTVKIRRWRLDANKWNSGISYHIGHIVKSKMDNNLYIKIRESGVSVIEPSIDNNHEEWLKWYDTSTSVFGGFANFDENFSGVGNKKNGETLIFSDYQDFYTFGILGEEENSTGISTTNPTIYYKDFSIGKITNYSYLFLEHSLTTFLIDVSKVLAIENVHMDDDCIANAFILGRGMINVHFRDGSLMNLFSTPNAIYNVDTKATMMNTCTDSLINIKFENEFAENCIGKMQDVTGKTNFSNNYIRKIASSSFGDDANDNTIIDMRQCKIENGFKNNLILSNVNNNIFNFEVSNVQINDNFMYNTFETQVVNTGVAIFSFDTISFPEMYEDTNVWVFRNQGGGSPAINLRYRFYDSLHGLQIKNISLV